MDRNKREKKKEDRSKKTNKQINGTNYKYKYKDTAVPKKTRLSAFTRVQQQREHDRMHLKEDHDGERVFPASAGPSCLLPQARNAACALLPPPPPPVPTAFPPSRHRVPPASDGRDDDAPHKHKEDQAYIHTAPGKTKKKKRRERENET